MLVRICGRPTEGGNCWYISSRRPSEAACRRPGTKTSSLADNGPSSDSLVAQSCTRARKQRQVQIADLAAEIEWLESHVSNLRAEVGKSRETLALLSASNSELKDSVSALRGHLQMLDQEKARLLQSIVSCGAGQRSQVNQQPAPQHRQEGSAGDVLLPTDISANPRTDPLPATLRTLAPTSISALAVFSSARTVPEAGRSIWSSHRQDTAHLHQMSLPIAYQQGPSSEAATARLQLPSRELESEASEAAEQPGSALSGLKLGEQPASLPRVWAEVPRQEAFNGAARAALPADVWSAPVPFAAGAEKGWHAADCLDCENLSWCMPTNAADPSGSRGP